MKILSLLLITTWFGANAQLRHYGTKDYTEYLKKSGDKEKTFDSETKEIKLPVTLSLTFVLLTKDATKDQLIKQITILNEDFSNKTFENAETKNSHYKHLAVDTEIRFCENFDLIEAYSDVKIDIAMAQEYAKKMALGGKPTIPIFICELDQVAGFAQPPGYLAENDAIFLDKDYLISSATKDFDLGKTFTHLMGSYLGLGELWGCVDDGVFDTPMHTITHQNAENSISSCYDYLVWEMPENFMDATSDKFQNMFTLGQKEKILFELKTRRQNLLSNENCK